MRGSRQLVDRGGKRLAVRFYVSPDVSVAAMARGFLGVVNAFGLGQLPEKRMPEDVRRHVDPLSIRYMGVGLPGDPLEDLVELMTC